MIHYTCDRCYKHIDTETDLRYQVNVVTQVILENPDESEVSSADHLDDLDELLQRVDDEDCQKLCEDLYRSRRYDLCSCCYEQYKQNPLGAEANLQVEFSEN